jgi:hypothetical protein
MGYLPYLEVYPKHLEEQVEDLLEVFPRRWEAEQQELVGSPKH